MNIVTIFLHFESCFINRAYIYLTIQQGDRRAIETDGSGNVNRKASREANSLQTYTKPVTEALHREVFMESISNRIAELSAIITESLKDTSVKSAIVWAAAVKERSALMDALKAIKK